MSYKEISGSKPSIEKSIDGIYLFLQCELDLRLQQIENGISILLKRPPDIMGLISEFLTDWKWGNAFEDHFFRFDTVPHLMMHCKCALPNVYWEWFEKKWEERKK